MAPPKAGEIQPTVGIHQDQLGPRVVWLTGELRPEAQGWCSTDPIKITAVIAVEIDDARRWSEFAREHGVADEWYDGLASVGGADSWYVLERPIRGEEFVALVFTPLELAGDKDGEGGGFRDLRRGEPHSYDAEELQRLLDSPSDREALSLFVTKKGGLAEDRQRDTGRNDRCWCGSGKIQKVPRTVELARLQSVCNSAPTPTG